MGKLGDQPPRNRFDQNLALFISDIQDAAKKTGISFQDALKAAEILELERRNQLFRQDGDYFDEQMGGFGEIFERIASSLEGLIEPNP